MIRVNQVKLQIKHNDRQLYQKTASVLGISVEELSNLKIVRKSIDARKKPDLYYSYTVEVAVKNESKVLKRFKNKENLVSRAEDGTYQFPASGKIPLKHKIVIVGMGPAGLFCAYYLASNGYPVLLLERGKKVEDRQKDVQLFWETGVLNPTSNVQFGEGGAGTFSDGKLNTLVKDKDGRNHAVLDTFVKFGAKESICYDAKPHIGTDVLCEIVRKMREEIIVLGGEVRFESCVTDFHISENQITGIIINHTEMIPCEQVVLAVGHSARDTFEKLYDLNIPMQAKDFAVGMRVEHLQDTINLSQYGSNDRELLECLGAAAYKVTAKTTSGRGVYSFCMCPGGYVVNASSEPERLVVNGMSYSDRNSANANSAIVVTVSKEDFGSDHPLAGIAFQRELEHKAYKLGNGKIPVQRFGDYKAKVLKITVENHNETIVPVNKGQYTWADLSSLFSQQISEAFVEGMEEINKQIVGFADPGAILSGIESRTSSPVRISRDTEFQSEVRGLYPCGEGAGYAGGITSAAMDGMRVAEAIAKIYAPTAK